LSGCYVAGPEERVPMSDLVTGSALNGRGDEHQAQIGQVLCNALIASAWTIANARSLSPVCFTRDRLDISGFLASLRERNIVWMSEAQLNGSPVIRACITSFRASEADIHWVVSEMNFIASPGGCHTIDSRIAP